MAAASPLGDTLQLAAFPIGVLALRNIVGAAPGGPRGDKLMIRLRSWWLVLACLAGSPAAVTAQVADPVPAPDAAVVRPAPPVFAANGRPRIGLVLGGGGAKGFAHIGVIEELERRHIPIDVIAGTSMGAVVGSMYAIGNDAAGIKAIAGGIDWVTVFNDRPERNELSFRRKREVREILLNYRLGIEDGKPVLPRGALGGQRLFSTVQELLVRWRATEDFNDLPIPFRAVATNIVTGRRPAGRNGYRQSDDRRLCQHVDTGRLSAGEA